jgi:hypothetical protein
MCDVLRLKHPFSCLVSGPIGSGKSFCIRFLHHLVILCTEHTFDGGVIFCYSERSAVPSRQLAGKKNVRFKETKETDFDNPEVRPCLIILHDLLNYV